MTDYDDVRVCCSDKKICTRCWGYIAMATKVLDTIVREDFGFKHLLWVYSGRRGIHLWISDAAALALTDAQRSALVKYLDLKKGPKLRFPFHPSVARSVDVLRSGFQSVVLEDQDLFQDEDKYQKLLDKLPEQSASRRLGDRADVGSGRGGPAREVEEEPERVVGAAMGRRARLGPGAARLEGPSSFSDLR